MRRSWLGEGQTEGWIAHRLSLMVSPAWRHRPMPLVRILERLEIEHLRHGGVENGNLAVAYDQFVKAGVSRRVVAPALVCGVHLGLIEVRQVHEMVSNIKAPNVYRLTYVPEKGKRAPTDEWEAVTEDHAKAAVEYFQKSQTKSRGQFPFLQPPSSPSCKKTARSSSPSCISPVPHGEHTLISGGNADARTDPSEQERRGRPHTTSDAPAPSPSPSQAGPVPISQALLGSRLLRGAGERPSRQYQPGAVTDALRAKLTGPGAA